MLQLKLNPGTLLWKAVSLLMEINGVAIVKCSPAGLLMKNLVLRPGVVAEFQISPWSFNSYYCDGDYTVLIGLLSLSDVLKSISDQESLTITYTYKKPNSNHVQITIEDTTGIRSTSEVKIRHAPIEYVYPYVSPFEHKRVVGIPSSKFRQILTHLRRFGETVNIRVTAAQVKLTTANREMVLTKQHGCSILVNGGDDPVLLVISLQYVKSFLEASRLSYTVWMLRLVYPEFLLGTG
ncbi:unnamed protein product [Ilex paraguariensis]|uniref:Checkpoint protein n=1 Tax=Ilex paraguariensis TaxID=185542 RepID=A0ABC8TIT3_9AQUA